MAHRIAGIDLSGNEIRIVVLASGFRKVRVDSVEKIDCPDGCWREEGGNGLSVSESGLRLLGEWARDNLSQGDVMVISCPALFSITKTLKFPFKDTEKIRKVLPFQLIGNFPVDIDDIIADFDFVETSGKEAAVMASGVIREKFSRFFYGLKEANIDPRVVSLDGFALFDLLKFVDAGRKNSNLFFLNARVDRLEVFASSAGKPVFVRSIYLNGFEDDSDLLDYVIRELKVSLLSFMTRHGGRIDGVLIDGDAPGKIYDAITGVCGEFDLAILNIVDLNIEMEGSEALRSGFLKAFSLAIRGLLPAEQGRLNLRRGEFVYSGSIRFLHEKMKYLAAFFAFFLVLLGSQAYLKISSLKGELSALRADLRAFSAGNLGKEFDDFGAALRYMKDYSAEESRILPEWSAVDTLKKILNTAASVVGEQDTGIAGGPLPAAGDEAFGVSSEEMNIEFENFRIEPKSAYIRGEANSIVTIEKFIAKQKEDPCFRDVVLESTDRIQFQRHQGWLRFIIKASIDCAAAQTPKEQEKKEK